MQNIFLAIKKALNPLADNSITLLWTFVFFISAYFAYLHVTLGYHFAKDMSIWFFHSEGWILRWDDTRLVAHALNGLPALITSLFTKKAVYLAYAITSSTWIYFCLSCYLSYKFILKQNERYLLVIYPLLWCAILIRGYLYSELYLSILLLIPVLLLLISEHGLNRVRVGWLHFLFIITAFTHQSSIMLYAIFLLYFIWKAFETRSLFGTYSKLSFVVLICSAINLYFILKPDFPVCRACRDDFGNTLFNFQGYQPLIHFLVFLSGIILTNHFGRISQFLFWVLFLYYFHQSYNTDSYYNLFNHWNNRVYAMVLFSMLTGLLLIFHKNTYLKSQFVKSMPSMALYCFLAVAISLPYLFKWEQFKLDTFSFMANSENINKKIIHITNETPLFAQTEYFFPMTIGESIPKMPVLFQIFENKIVSKTLFSGNNNESDASFLIKLLDNDKFEIEISEDLRRCILKIKETPGTPLSC